MEELFYSTSEKKLFFIAGYTDNSRLVKDIVSTLENCKSYFIKQCQLPKNALIKTDYVTKSSRYKSMRYFWIDDVKTPPKDAFKIGKDWTMDKWITN